jgi:hypothetical protein
MRKVLFVVLAAGALLCSGSAWAVVDTTITITDKSGKPIPEGTVTLTREDKKPAPKPKTPKTDETGKITVTHDEQKDKGDDKGIVIVTVHKNHETLTARTTLEDLFKGGTIIVERSAPARTTERTSPARPAVTEKPLTSPAYIMVASPYTISVSGGANWTHFSSKYSSTGVQAAASGSSHATASEACAGINGYWPIASGPIEYGGGINLCEDFTGTTTLFDIVRHGLTGHVIATIDPGPRIELYAGVHYAGPAQTQFYMRIGPDFAYNKLSVTSNQVPGGGVFETASNSFWATGLGLQAGASHPVCTDCFFGLPVSASIGGKFAWYPGSHSVAVNSVLDFTETATVDHVTQYSLVGALSVPFGAPSRP